MVFKKGNIPWNKNKKGCISEETRKKISVASTGCNNGNYKGLISIICIACGKEFFVHPHQSKRKFCSHKCQGAVCRGDANLAKRPEIREKISKATKGRIVSEETKLLCSKNHPDFSKEKHPLWGKHHSEETRRKISESHKGIKTGKNNPNWRGGERIQYCFKFNNEFKIIIRNLFDNKCFICGKTSIENGLELTVHHIDYNKNSLCKGKAWAFITLCNHCHGKTNYNRWYWFNLLINYWLNNPDIHLNTTMVESL